MEALAAIRPDDWNLALFLHVLGSMVLVGGLVLAAIYLGSAWRGGGADSLRAGFRTLLFGVLPGYIVMRGTAEWIRSKEGLDELPEDPDWIGIGYMTADIGLVLLVIAAVLAGVGARRAAGPEGGPGGGSVGVRAATALVSVVLVAYVVATWAMTTKPA